uniref:Plastocyanin-like domain-containing protein n=1 Tax=Oryza meridionalis TaxID=40149 RepID=A0A0E0BWE2_9ORYZ
MSPRIQQLAVMLLAAVVVVAAARDEPAAAKNYQTQWDTVMSILNCKSDSLIPSYICSVISKSRWGWASDDPNDDDEYTPDHPLPAPAAGWRRRPVMTSLNLTKYVDALPRIAKIRGYGIRHGRPVPIKLTIGMYSKTWQFHRDMPPTPVFVYGQSLQTATFPGPTIVARQGVPLAVEWQNHLPDAHILPWDPKVPTAIPKKGGVPTVVHLHGGAHPPEFDGHAFAWFTRDFAENGSTWTRKTYRYPNVQAPGNLWYHDHALGLTRVSLLAGLLAAYVIEKPELEAPMSLPCGDHDLHLVIADREFYTNGSISIDREWKPEYFGLVITVNGKAWPYLSVHRRRYRLRILNASNARYFNVTLSNGALPFTVIGSDSSYLSRPVTVSNLVLSPAEIFDVIVDFSRLPAAVTEIEMLNTAPYPFPNGTQTDPNLDGKVMLFKVAGKGKVDDMPDKSRVPEHGVPYASVAALPPPTTTRYIVLYENQTAPGNLYINGLRLEDPVTETPKSGTTELWQVINLTGDNHPLHLHIATFQAVKMTKIEGFQEFKTCMIANNNTATCNLTQHAVGPVVPVPEEEKTWKNAVKIPPEFMTSVVVAFRLVEANQPYPFDATTEPGFVYHCHMGPRIQQLAAMLLAAVVVVAAARDEPAAAKNYQTQWDTVMSILNCKSDSLIPSYICSVISKSRWGWASDDPDDYTPAADPSPTAARPLRSTADLPKYVDPLPQMARIQGYGINQFGFPVPTNLTIGMYNKTWQFHRDMPPTPVFVYGQSLQTATFPGPTIVARYNVPLYVTWENHLPDAHILPWDPTVPTAIPKNGGVPTVVHLHGAAQAPDSDGHALAWFTRDFAENGSTWTQKTYTYPNVQPAAGNIWYHDHALGLTRASLLAGLLAAYIVEWPELEMPFNLPSGEFDLHLVIADRKFNTDGTIFMDTVGAVPSVHPQWQPEYFGEVITVNGKAWPFQAVQRRRYRLRILNASNARYLNIRFSNGLPFTVIASDATYLSRPVTVSNLLLSPAEIFDVIVDFSLVVNPNATDIELLNSAPYPFPTGTPANATLDGKVMSFNVSAKWQLWHVINLTPDNHPLHLHLAEFQAVQMLQLVDPDMFKSCMLQHNDTFACNLSQHAVGALQPVPEEEKTWKNVVKIPPAYVTSVVVAFRLVHNNMPYPFDATAAPGYVYHCHILDHEDNAMIRPLTLLP